MASSIEDIEVLVRSDHRVAAHRALAEGPSDRAAWQAVSGASKATVARLLTAFEDRHWIVRDGQSIA